MAGQAKSMFQKLLGLEQELGQVFRSPDLGREEPAKHWTDLMQREVTSKSEDALFVAAFLFGHASSGKCFYYYYTITIDRKSVV